MSRVTTKYGPLPSVAMKYLPIIEKYSKKYNVPVIIIANVIKAESGGNPEAWNGQGGENSRGLMQMSQKTALTHPSQMIPVMLLDTLYEADYNIQQGTKLLSYIRDFLKPHFQSDSSLISRWRAVANSYNQGEGYYRDALRTVTSQGKSQDWETVKYYVLNPIVRTSHPWPENVEFYANKVLEGVTEGQLKGTFGTFSKPTIANPTSFLPWIAVTLAGMGAIYFATQLAPRPVMLANPRVSLKKLFGGL